MFLARFSLRMLTGRRACAARAPGDPSAALVDLHECAHVEV